MQYTMAWFWKYALLSLAGWVLLFRHPRPFDKRHVSRRLPFGRITSAPDAYPFDMSRRLSTP